MTKGDRRESRVILPWLKSQVGKTGPSKGVCKYSRSECEKHLLYRQPNDSNHKV